MSKDNALTIRGLTKRYGATVAVDDLTLTVPQGEFFGFLGPNGAGKTTTIHCTTGISTFREGTVEVFGVDVQRSYREARQRIGLSPQEFNVDIFAPAWKILDYMGGYFGMPYAARLSRIEELLSRFDLEKHRNKKFQELSGGLKRRVILARALIHNPDLVILDEPTAGVDVELRRDLWGYFRDLNREGKTIILTSHYLEEVQQLAQRVAMIRNGKIVADGTIAELTKGKQTLEDVYLEVMKGAA